MYTLGVFASIFDETSRILLVRQAYGSRQWTTPGGRVDAGESLLVALEHETLEEIACDVRIEHLIGVYAKPYRDDLVLSFAAALIRGTPQPCLPEISEVSFFTRSGLPRNLAFNTRVRIDDAFDGHRGIVRVFNSAESLVAHFCSQADA